MTGIVIDPAVCLKQKKPPMACNTIGGYGRLPGWALRYPMSIAVDLVPMALGAADLGTLGHGDLLAFAAA